MLKQSTSGGVQSGWIGHTQDWTRLDWTGVRSCLRLSDLFLSRADIAAEDEYQMSLSMSSVSLLLLPRGVPSLESHSPSFTIPERSYLRDLFLNLTIIFLAEQRLISITQYVILCELLVNNLYFESPTGTFFTYFRQLDLA